MVKIVALGMLVVAILLVVHLFWSYYAMIRAVNRMGAQLHQGTMDFILQMQTDPRRAYELFVILRETHEDSARRGYHNPEALRQIDEAIAKLCAQHPELKTEQVQLTAPEPNQEESI